MPNANRNTECMDESEGDGRKTRQKAKIQFVLPDCSFAINAFFNVVYAVLCEHPAFSASLPSLRRGGKL